MPGETLTLNKIEVGDIAFHRPFHVGGIGTMSWHRPFDVEAPAAQVAFHRMFLVMGQAQAAFHRPFDIDGPILWQFHRPFHVQQLSTSPGTKPRIGVNLHASGSIPPSPFYTSTLAAGASAGATFVDLTSVSGLAVGAILKIGAASEYRMITAISGTEASFAQGLGQFWPAGTPVNGTSGFLSGMTICTKAGVVLGVLPDDSFTIDSAPKQVISGQGQMSFRMPRKEENAAGEVVDNPHLALLADDRLVFIDNDAGLPAWAGTMHVRDWGDGQVQVDVADATTLLEGPNLTYEEVITSEIVATAIVGTVLTAMNDRRALKGELVWDRDLTGSKPFRGESTWETTAFQIFSDIAERTVTEFSWRPTLVGGQLHVTLLWRDSFNGGAGVELRDGDGGNVVRSPRLYEDPNPILHSVKVVGKANDLADEMGNCFDWALGDSGSMVPTAYAEIDPGDHRERGTLEVSVDWGYSPAEAEAAAAALMARVMPLFHSFIYAHHDTEGRPWHEGWKYEGPPADYEEFLHTGLNWRTRRRLAEWPAGEPVALVMRSWTEQQVLIVQYDRVTGIQTVRRVWSTQDPAGVWITRARMHGWLWRYQVTGGVITGRVRDAHDHNSAIVGPPVSYTWYRDTGTETHVLRRVTSLTEDGATSEDDYFEPSDVPTGPTDGVYYDPPFNTQPIFTRPTIGDAPYYTFTNEQIPNDVEGSGDDRSFILKVYDFELQRICDWDPRRDGVGAHISREFVNLNEPSTETKWWLVPWGQGGDGQTSLVYGIDENETQILIASAFVLPTTAPYEATIGSAFGAEDVLVTAINGTLLTVVRGYNGTVQIIHEGGTAFQAKNVEDSGGLFTELPPWPAGQAYAEELLATLSQRVRRLTTHVANEDGGWATITEGSVHPSAIQNQGPTGGITGDWRMLGWAPDYYRGIVEIMVEEVV